MARGYFTSRDNAKKCRKTKTAKNGKSGKSGGEITPKNLDFTAKISLSILKSHIFLLANLFVAVKIEQKMRKTQPKHKSKEHFSEETMYIN